MAKPDCSAYSIWIGKEVEGDVDIGVETLFIRQLSSSVDEFTNMADELIPRMTKKGAITRVWFCKEFTNWQLLREIAKHFRTVCVETTTKAYGNLPRDLLANFTIYLKLDFLMKQGDFVCVGPAYQDEAFRIGTGHKVKPEHYNTDTKIR